MRFHHRFKVGAGRTEVADFHRLSSTLSSATPPPIVTRMQSAPDELGEGDRMAFTLWLGPVPIRWQARIEKLDRTGFTDVQEVGPFRHWKHRHEFNSIDDATTEVIDTIEFGLRRHLVWGPIGLSMALGLPLLFAYRGWKTRKLLIDSRSARNGAGGRGSADREEQ